MDEMRRALLLRSHSQKLLPTSVHDVPPEYISALAGFCEEATEIERGYICAVAVKRDAAEPERQLEFCVKLNTPVSEPQDSREASLALLSRLSLSHAQLIREIAFGVMADRAVSAWEANALRIYPR